MSTVRPFRSDRAMSSRRARGVGAVDPEELVVVHEWRRFECLGHWVYEQGEVVVSLGQMAGAFHVGQLLAGHYLAVCRVAVEGLDDVFPQVPQKAHRAAQANDVARVCGNGVETPAQLVQLALEPFGIGEEKLSVLGEGGGARRPAPQVHAEFLLEPAHRPAQALGSDSEVFCGARQAVLTLECCEVRERLGVHACASPLMLKRRHAGLMCAFYLVWTAKFELAHRGEVGEEM